MANRDAVIEECAKVLDAAADDWRRIRDPGMANNAAHYAQTIRALKVAGTEVYCDRCKGPCMRRPRHDDRDIELRL